MQREGMFREMKNRRNFEKPSERRAREAAESTRRVRKLMRIEIPNAPLRTSSQCREKQFLLMAHSGKRPCCVRETLRIEIPHALLCSSCQR